MKVVGDFPRVVDWASTPGNTLEPTAGEKAQGWQQGYKVPARKLNWLIQQQFELAKMPIKSLVGAVNQYASPAGLNFASMKWNEPLGIWMGIPNSDSNVLYWSPDGVYWQTGANYTITGTLPTPGAIDVLEDGSIYFGTDDVTDITTARIANPKTGTFTVSAISATTGAARGVFSRRGVEGVTNTKTVVTGGASGNYVMVNQSFGGAFATVSGFSPGTVNRRLMHYSVSTWYGIVSSAGGYKLFRFYDTTADLTSAVDIFSFQTPYPNFTPTHLDADTESGRIVVLGRDLVLTENLLRILYSDDLGASWTDATVPEFDVGLSADGVTSEKVQHLGGGYWIARLEETPAASGHVPINHVFSIDNGLTWHISQLAMTNYEQLEGFHDFDFNGSYWLGSDDSLDYLLRGNPLL